MKKSVLITGGSSGIGFALAKLYLLHDHNVIITGRNSEKLELAKEKLSRINGSIEAYCVDVSNMLEMKHMIDEIEKTYVIDTVIVNAGVSESIVRKSMSKENTLYEDSLVEEFNIVGEQIIKINVLGVFNTVNPVLAYMKKRSSGNIVLISSLRAFFGFKRAPFYSASKAALKNYGESLRVLLKPFNINVLTVFPGFVKSDMTKNYSHKMPFIIETDKSARIIYNAILRKKGYKSFPLSLVFATYILNILPFIIREKFISFVTKFFSK